MEFRRLCEMPTWEAEHRFSKTSETLLSVELAEEIEQINERRTALAARQQTLKQEMEAVREVPVEEMNLEPIKGLASERIAIIQEEIAYRREFIQLHEKVREAVVERWNVQIDFVEQAKAEIEQALLGLGYHPRSSGNPDPCKIQPGWILSHPRVREESEYLTFLQSTAHNRDLVKLNEQLLADAEHELNSLREKALVALH